MTLGTIRIEPRFHGPPNSSNGGYACGRIAAFIEGAAEVTLRKPPPLSRDLTVRTDNGEVALCDGDVLIGSGHATSVDVPDIKPLNMEEALAAAGHTFAADLHPLPTCFVCGPARDPGDGLRIRVGPVDPQDTDWTGVLAAPWRPDASLADDAGAVRPEFVWAALDCPTGHAVSSSRGLRIILLGRQAVDIMRLPRAGEPCIVAAREISHDGRKSFAEAVLFSESGETLASCRATWIEVSSDVQTGIGV